MEQKALLEIDLNIAGLASEAAAGKKNIQDLADKLKILKFEGKENTKEFVQLTAEIQNARAGVADQVKALGNLEKATKINNGSINEMRASLSLMTRTYNALSKEERENIDVGVRLQKNMKDQSDELKHLEKNVGNTSRNVGNYKEAITDALGGMLPMNGALASGAKVFNSMTMAGSGNISMLGRLKAALIATGIGAVIVIVGLLINYMRGLDSVMDKVSQVTEGLGSAFNAVGRTIASASKIFTNTGEALRDLGNFLLHPIDSMKKFGKEIANVTKESMKLKEAQQDLEDAISNQEINTAKTQARVAQLILKSRNRSYSNADRERFLKEAGDLDKKDFNARSKNADGMLNNAIEVAKNEGQLNAKQLAELKRRGTEYAQELVNQNKIKQPQLDAIKAAEMEIIKTTEESTNRQEKIQTKRDEVADKAQKEAETRAGKAESAAAKRKTEQDRLDEEQKQKDEEILAKKQEHNLELDRITQEDFDILKSINQKKMSEREIELQNDRDHWLKLGEARIAAGLDASIIEEQLNASQADINRKYDSLAFDEKIRVQEELDLSAQTYHEKELMRKEDLRRAEEAFADAKRETVGAGLDFLTGVFSKQTAVGKAAFLAQKAFAVGEIAVSVQKEMRRNSEAAATERLANAAASLLAGPAAPAVLGILNAKTTASMITRNIWAMVSGGIQAATVIGSAVSGFARGGVYNSNNMGGMVYGAGTGTSDSINARLSHGESTINARSTQMFAPLLSLINQAGGGRSFTGASGTSFASGGVFGGYGLQMASSSIIDTGEIIKQTAIEVSSMMPRQVLVIEDVQSSLGDKTYIQSRSNM